MLRPQDRKHIWINFGKYISTSCSKPLFLLRYQNKPLPFTLSCPSESPWGHQALPFIFSLSNNFKTTTLVARFGWLLPSNQCAMLTKHFYKHFRGCWHLFQSYILWCYDFMFCTFSYAFYPQYFLWLQLNTSKSMHNNSNEKHEPLRHVGSRVLARQLSCCPVDSHLSGENK